MADRTIKIDSAAYNRLRKVKRKDESFSQVIKRVIPEPTDFKTWLRELEANPASDEFIAAVEDQIANRRASRDS